MVGGETLYIIVSLFKNMIKYDKLLRLLEESGYTPTRIIKEEKILGAKTFYQMKNGETTIGLTDKTINKLCNLLRCTPSDIIEYIPDPEPEPKAPEF